MPRTRTRHQIFTPKELSQLLSVPLASNTQLQALHQIFTPKELSQLLLEPDRRGLAHKSPPLPPIARPLPNLPRSTVQTVTGQLAGPDEPCQHPSDPTSHRAAAKLASLLREAQPLSPLPADNNHEAEARIATPPGEARPLSALRADTNQERVGQISTLLRKARPLPALQADANHETVGQIVTPEELAWYLSNRRKLRPMGTNQLPNAYPLPFSTATHQYRTEGAAQSQSNSGGKPAGKGVGVIPNAQPLPPLTSRTRRKRDVQIFTPEELSRYLSKPNNRRSARQVLKIHASGPTTGTFWLVWAAATFGAPFGLLALSQEMPGLALIALAIFTVNIALAVATHGYRDSSKWAVAGRTLANIFGWGFIVMVSVTILALILLLIVGLALIILGFFLLPGRTSSCPNKRV